MGRGLPAPVTHCVHEIAKGQPMPIAHPTSEKVHYVVVLFSLERKALLESAHFSTFAKANRLAKTLSQCELAFPKPPSHVQVFCCGERTDASAPWVKVHGKPRVCTSNAKEAACTWAGDMHH